MAFILRFFSSSKSGRAVFVAVCAVTVVALYAGRGSGDDGGAGAVQLSYSDIGDDVPDPATKVEEMKQLAEKVSGRL